MYLWKLMICKTALFDKAMNQKTKCKSYKKNDAVYGVIISYGCTMPTSFH